MHVWMGRRRTRVCQSKCTDDNQRETSWNDDEVNAQARIDTPIDASNTIEKGEQTGTWVRQVARAMEEQL